MKLKALFFWFTCIFLAGCAPQSKELVPPISNSNQLDKLERFVIEVAYLPEMPREKQITPPNENIITILKEFQRENRTDHLPYLIEYGLKLHWINLQYTNLARELSINENLMLSELVRIAKIPKYRTAYEAGWLNRQFHGKFNRTGCSSYQIYIWVKENTPEILGEYPNAERIFHIMESIDSSGKNGVGGRGVCHYGCQ